MQFSIRSNSIYVRDFEIKYSDIISKLSLHNNDIAYISGSLVEGVLDEFGKGMGNQYSDIDVFIIREHSLFVETESIYCDQYKKTTFIDDSFIALDVEIIDLDYINALAEAIKVAHRCSSTKIKNALSSNGLKFENLIEVNSLINRLYHSICIFNESGYLEVVQKVDFAKFLKVMTEYYIVDFYHAKQDAIGNLREEQYDVALFCARNAFSKVLLAFLADKNIFVDRIRWAFLKFLNYVKAHSEYYDLFFAYEKLFRCDLKSAEVCKNTILEAIRYGEMIIEGIIMEELKI